MRWSIVNARQQFADLVRAAAEEPQPVYNRERMVAVVVDPASFEEFQAWQRQRGGSIADSFAELHAIFAEVGWDLELPERRTRPNPLAGTLDGDPR